MAIQHRRGVFDRFNPNKMRPGEWAVVVEGDPSADDGRACYICFAAGNVKRMFTYEDASVEVRGLVDKFKEQFVDGVNTATADADAAAKRANDAAAAAETSTETSKKAVEDTKAATDKANTAAASIINKQDKLTAGENIAIEGTTIRATYEDATVVKAGLMSPTDKRTLDGITTGATVANKAAKLSKKRNVSLTGKLKGSATWDGSTDLAIELSDPSTSQSGRVGEGGMAICDCANDGSWFRLRGNAYWSSFSTAWSSMVQPAGYAAGNSWYIDTGFKLPKAPSTAVAFSAGGFWCADDTFTPAYTNNLSIVIDTAGKVYLGSWDRNIGNYPFCVLLLGITFYM